jgi:hypothetical protein
MPPADEGSTLGLRQHERRGAVLQLGFLSRYLPVAAVIFAALGSVGPDAATAAGTGAFALAAGTMTPARQGSAAAPLLGGGRVLLAGRVDGSAASATAVTFNAFSGQFQLVGSMGTPREDAAAASLGDGSALVVGGNNFAALESAEIFDPVTNSFSSAGVGSMGSYRSSPVAAPLPGGRVLVAGGYGGPVGGPNTNLYLKTAEMFDPATKTFSSTGVGQMSVGRFGAAAATLADGRVLVVGGYDGVSYLTSAEIFNPATNTFSSAGIGPMTTPREGAIAAPLTDGEVLVAGGYYNDGTGHSLSSAEIFDPATNSFSSGGIGSMATPRYDAAGARLSDGRVLVAGGSNGVSDLSTAELFTFRPTSASNPPPASRSTGRRAAALKRCKKRARKHDWPKKRLRKCKKQARLLPI